MPLFTTRDKHRRDQLVSVLTGVGCRICQAMAGTGCEYGFETSEDLVMLSGDPQLFAHASRLASALRAHPEARSLAIAQFAPGTIPDELAFPARPRPAPVPPEPANACPRPCRDPAGYRSSASHRPRRAS